jgi:hypothetical protein
VNAGAVACLLVVAGGCTSTVEVDGPDLSGSDAAACADLVDALPDRVADQLRRPVEPDDRAGAAWGDPAIVLRCGVPEPPGSDELSTCQVTDGVAWFIPDEQITGQAVDIVMTTIGRSPGVEVRIPADYFPPAATMVDVGASVRRHTDRFERCG